MWFIKTNKELDKYIASFAIEAETKAPEVKGDREVVQDKGKTLERAIDEVSSEEYIDALIAKLQAKKQNKLSQPSVKKTADVLTLSHPEKALDFDQIKGDDFLQRCCLVSSLKKRVLTV